VFALTGRNRYYSIETPGALKKIPKPTAMLI
jgi:hypothetical protein